jgi:hypothetical protein
LAGEGSASSEAPAVAGLLPELPAWRCTGMRGTWMLLANTGGIFIMGRAKRHVSDVALRKSDEIQKK